MQRISIEVASNGYSLTFSGYPDGGCKQFVAKTGKEVGEIIEKEICNGKATTRK